jgi:hypothetical protein
VVEKRHINISKKILGIICLFQEVWHNIATISPYVEKGEQT